MYSCLLFLISSASVLNLTKVKEESEQVGLKLNIQKTKIMASGPITSWQIDRETMETVTDFILGGSKITANGDCSHEIKRRLLLGRKVITNLDSMVLEKSLESPLDCKEIQAVHPKEIISEHSLEGLMLKLKLQYFGQLMQRTDSFEKTLMLGKTESRRRRGRQRMKWLDGISDWMHMNLMSSGSW